MYFTRLFVDMLGQQESPTTYLRWSAISMAGAALGRRAKIVFGSKDIYANQYIILIGPPGGRKSTGPDEAKKIMQAAGYNKFGPDKGRKEALWSRMEKISKGEYSTEQEIKGLDSEDITIDDLLGAGDGIGEMYLIAEEWVAFMGNNDEDLVDALTMLWNCPPIFQYDRTTKDDLTINKPTMSMLGAATPSSFTRAIPPTAIGGGFMRRILLIHGEQQDKVFWPSDLDQDKMAELFSIMQLLMSSMSAVIRPDQGALKALEKLYTTRHFLTDSRFETYIGVRHVHLLKMCLISACARDSGWITEEDVVYCNTLLARAELAMPNALGHFGMAKNSTVANIILDAIKQARTPPTLRELYKHTGADIGSMLDLKKVLEMLKELDKITTIKAGGTMRYIPKNNLTEQLKKWPCCDLSLLLPSEAI